MAGLLYFLPKETRKLRQEELPDVGLAYAFDRNPTSNHCGKGPDGNPGMVLAAGDTKVGYYAEQQTWRKIPGNPAGALVGYYTDNPPKPEDLERGKLLPGHLVELADGNRWLCPIARGLSEEEDQLRWYTALPEGTDVDDDGNWTQTGVLAQYAKLWDIALAWWDTLWEEMGKSDPGVETEADSPEAPEDSRIKFHFSGLNDAALMALATNYRVSKAEVALLGLFTGGCTPHILGALVDWPTYQAHAKKNRTRLLAGFPTGDGRKGDTKDTDQA